MAKVKASCPRSSSRADHGQTGERRDKPACWNWVKSVCEDPAWTGQCIHLRSSRSNEYRRAQPHQILAPPNPRNSPAAAPIFRFRRNGRSLLGRPRFRWRLRSKPELRRRLAPPARTHLPEWCIDRRLGKFACRRHCRKRRARHLQIFMKQK